MKTTLIGIFLATIVLALPSLDSQYEPETKNSYTEDASSEDAYCEYAPERISTSIKKTIPKEEVAETTIYYSCVKTARAEGLELPLGDARYLVPNSPAIVGGGILFEYKNTYHVALILEFREGGFWVVEGNYVEGERTYRLVDYNDPFITGFWTRAAYEQSLFDQLSLRSATSSPTSLSQ